MSTTIAIVPSAYVPTCAVTSRGVTSFKLTDVPADCADTRLARYAREYAEAKAKATEGK